MKSASDGKRKEKNQERDEWLCFCSNSVEMSPVEEDRRERLLPTSCPASALVWPPFVVLVKEL